MAEVSKEQLAEELDKDDRWLKEHLEELVKSYPRKVIAVLDQRIIVMGDSILEVWRMAEDKYPDRVPLIFQIPTPEDFQCAL